MNFGFVKVVTCVLPVCSVVIRGGRGLPGLRFYGPGVRAGPEPLS